jgi:hypothetical protein
VVPGTNPGALSQQTSAGAATGAGIAGRAQQAQEVANKSPALISALSEARNIIEKNPSILSGGMTPALNDLKSTLAGVGIDVNDAADANMLAKQLAFSSALRANSLGVGGTDAGRALADHASPRMEGDAKSLPLLIRQSIALERYNLGVANAQSKAKTPEEQAAVERNIRSSPRAMEAYEYKETRSPEESAQFLRDHKMTAAEMKAALDSLRKAGGL